MLTSAQLTEAYGTTEKNSYGISIITKNIIRKASTIL